MKNWYALSNGGDMIALGKHENFEAADESLTTDVVWIVDEETAREWLNQLMVLLENDE